jgi:hypothetical protein
MRRFCVGIALVAGAAWLAFSAARADSSAPTGGTSPCRVLYVPDGAGFDARGLPAISRDGQTLAIAVVDPDGGRAFPNFALDLVPASPRSSAPKRRIAILTVQQVDHADGVVTTELVTEMLTPLASANRELERGGYRPLPHIVVPGEARRGKFHAQGHGYQLRFEGGTLTFMNGGATAGALKLEPPPLKRAHCRGANTPFPANVWIAAAAHVALVEVDYAGNDTCWEPAPAWKLVDLSG